MVAAIEAGVPTLVEAREIITQFHLMIRRRLETGLTPWIERARASLIASFASGVARDEAAVRAAITSSWSNGQTEGQITRLELVRRQMYGGGKLDLLQARLIGAIGAAPKIASEPMLQAYSHYASRRHIGKASECYRCNAWEAARHHRVTRSPENPEQRWGHISRL
jgi:hypothetical protein